MTLEDRIRNTGEHVLGSFDTSPDLHHRISERVEHRVRQRRQRAAAGLGAGVVVVLGGLVVLNVPFGADPDRPTAAGGPLSSVTSLMVVTTLPAATVLASTPPPVDDLEPAPSLVIPPAPTTAATTTFAAVAADAPLLFTATPGEPLMDALDVATGARETITIDTRADTDPEPAATVSPSGFEYHTAAVADTGCGGLALSVTERGAPAPNALPATLEELLLSADGTVGVVRFTDCPDGVPAPEAAAQWAYFSADDPTLAPVPLSVPAAAELSTDGRYLAYETDGRVYVVDLTTGEPVPALPENCADPAPDSTYGYLMGADHFIALAQCDGRTSIVAGRLGEVSLLDQIEGCGREARLTVRPGATDGSAPRWMAVTDQEANLAWVIGPSGRSEALPVYEQVWWQPVG